MPTAIHSFSQEEIMAYLDGELAPERLVAAAQHLEQCRECQRWAADSQSLSQRLVDWQVETVTTKPPTIAAAVSNKPTPTFWRKPMPLIALSAAVALALCVIGVQFREGVWRSKTVRSTEAIHAGIQESTPLALHDRAFAPQTLIEPQERSAIGIVGGAPAPPSAPEPTAEHRLLIVRTAQLMLTSKNFDECRAAVERIVAGQHGYVAQLELTTSAGASRLLDASLRVPAIQLDQLLGRLGSLGHVDEESLHSEDVTRHLVDVAARLANMKTTEDRLLQILRERTGKLSDVLQVEEAVDRTRGEIEVAEAEHKMLSNQIAFANVHLRISEEYKTPLSETNSPSTITRLRNAAVDGYRSLAAFVVGFLTFILASGPSLLLAMAILFLPARWLYRKIRNSAAT